MRALERARSTLGDSRHCEDPQTMIGSADSQISGCMPEEDLGNCCRITRALDRKLSTYFTDSGLQRPSAAILAHWAAYNWAGQQAAYRMHCSTRGAFRFPSAAISLHRNVRTLHRVVARSQNAAQRRHSASVRRTLVCSADLQERVQSDTDEDLEGHSDGINGGPSPAADEGALTCSAKPCCMSDSSVSRSSFLLFLVP